MRGRELEGLLPAVVEDEPASGRDLRVELIFLIGRNNRGEV